MGTVYAFFGSVAYPDRASLSDDLASTPVLLLIIFGTFVARADSSSRSTAYPALVLNANRALFWVYSVNARESSKSASSRLSELLHIASWSCV